MRTFHILTFGCQMNVTDSQWLARALEARGFEEAPLECARVVVVNTCSVREKPERKVYDALHRVRKATEDIPGAFAVVAGCVAQQIGSGFFDKFDHVRLVVGGDSMPNAPEAIERLCLEPDLRLDLTSFSESFRERDAALGQTVQASEYVNIMQGCDNFCAYCIVPYTRGPQKSRSPEAVLADCRDLVAKGTREITLLGQNVNAFGLDGRGGEPGIAEPFAALLKSVAALPDLRRLRFVTPHPKDFSPCVVELFGTLPELCPRIHLPLQAGSDAVLARMGRRYTRDDFLRLVESIRRACPDVALSTDLIVGFPGETEQDFQHTLSMVREVNFMSGFSFCYSDRPGTASEMLADKIPAEEKAERLSRLQAQLDVQAESWLQGRVGLCTELLLEGPSRRQQDYSQSGGSIEGEGWQGKDPWGATVNVTLPAGLGQVGAFVPVRITGAGKHSLKAVLQTPHNQQPENCS